MNAAEIFLKVIKHPVKFRLFLLTKLPAAFFSGVQVVEVDESHAIVSIPFKWLTQNPFKSAYFASLSMAAELSTGVLAMMHIYKKDPAISMLVTKMEANYFKKATGKTFFICIEGQQIQEIIEECVISGESKSIAVRSIGKNKNDEPIAEFLFTWSFKAKANLPT